MRALVPAAALLLAGAIAGWLAWSASDDDAIAEDPTYRVSKERQRYVVVGPVWRYDPL